jgi:hypothetical protein
MASAGLPRNAQFKIGVKAVVDTSVFPESSNRQEDFGRAAVWNAYGAWKPEAVQVAAE